MVCIPTKTKGLVSWTEILCETFIVRRCNTVRELEVVISEDFVISHHLCMVFTISCSLYKCTLKNIEQNIDQTTSFSTGVSGSGINKSESGIMVV